MKYVWLMGPHQGQRQVFGVKSGRASKVVLEMSILWLTRGEAGYDGLCADKRAARGFIGEGWVEQRSSAVDEIVAVAAREVDGLWRSGWEQASSKGKQGLKEGGGEGRREKRDETTARLRVSNESGGRESECGSEDEGGVWRRGVARRKWQRGKQGWAGGTE